MDSNPLVTVGVASYNNASLIIDTLESINAQTYKNIELIIVDDCSKDNSAELISNWISHSRFDTKLIINEINKGVTRTCNILLNASNVKAKFLALFGSDDLMEPHRIETQVKFLQNEHPDASCSFSDMFIIDQNGEIGKKSYFELINENLDSIQELFDNPQEERISCFIRKNIFPSPSALYRKQALLDLGGYDETLFFEDWDIFLRLVYANHKFIYSNEKLVKYRIRNTSLSRTPSASYRSSYLRLISKYKGICKKIDRTIETKISEQALEVYQLGGTDAAFWLKRKLKITKDFKTLIYTALAICKIPYSALDHIKLFRRNVRKKALLKSD